MGTESKGAVAQVGHYAGVLDVLQTISLVICHQMKIHPVFLADLFDRAVASIDAQGGDAAYVEARKNPAVTLAAALRTAKWTAGDDVRKKPELSIILGGLAEARSMGAGEGSEDAKSDDAQDNPNRPG